MRVPRFLTLALFASLLAVIVVNLYNWAWLGQPLNW